MRRYRTVLTAFSEVARHIPIVLPIHPRTRARISTFGLDKLAESLLLLERLGSVNMLSLSNGAAVVLTDSGRLQEETTVLGVPCVTLREQTVRAVTMTEGTNRMAPWPLTVEDILATAFDAFERGRTPAASTTPEGWDGQADERIVEALAERCIRAG